MSPRSLTVALLMVAVAAGAHAQVQTVGLNLQFDSRGTKVADPKKIAQLIDAISECICEVPATGVAYLGVVGQSSLTNHQSVASFTCAGSPKSGKKLLAVCNANIKDGFLSSSNAKKCIKRKTDTWAPGDSLSLQEAVCSEGKTAAGAKASLDALTSGGEVVGVTFQFDSRGDKVGAASKAKQIGAAIADCVCNVPKDNINFNGVLGQSSLTNHQSVGSWSCVGPTKDGKKLLAVCTANLKPGWFSSSNGKSCIKKYTDGWAVGDSVKMESGTCNAVVTGTSTKVPAGPAASSSGSMTSMMTSAVTNAASGAAAGMAASAMRAATTALG